MGQPVGYRRKKGKRGGRREGAGHPTKATQAIKLNQLKEDIDLRKITKVQIIKLDIEPSLRMILLKEKLDLERSAITKKEEESLKNELEAVLEFIRSKNLEPELFVYLEEKVSVNPSLKVEE